MKKWLEKYHGCQEFCQWLKEYRTESAAWDACTNPEWMLEALQEVGYKDDAKLRLFACWVSRNTPIGGGGTVWDLLTHDDSRQAIIVAERFARGQATKEELAEAADAAGVVSQALWDQGREARTIPGAAYAAFAAWANARNASAAARHSARTAAGSAGIAQCNAIRSIFGNPFQENA